MDDERDRYIWLMQDRIYAGDDDEVKSRIDFLTVCFQENLNHARHVENERLTFATIYMALVGGGLAILFSMKILLLSTFMTIALVLTGIIALTLTRRWDNVFDRYMLYARGTYCAVHRALFKPEDRENASELDDDKKIFVPEKEDIDGIIGSPAFCFSPDDPHRARRSSAAKVMKNLLTFNYGKIRTRTWFTIFYVMIEIVLIGSFMATLIMDLYD